MKEHDCNTEEERIPGTCNKNILRRGMIAELGAINDYERMASNTDNLKIREQILNISKEEKTHFGEFQTLLLLLDPEQARELTQGKDEVVPRLKGKELMDEAYKIAEKMWVEKRTKEDVKDIIKEVEKYHPGIYPAEDNEELYYPAHAVESALKARMKK